MLTPSCPVPLVQCQCFFLHESLYWCHWGCQWHQISSPNVKMSTAVPL
ncbi:unnamed protein product [Staurois parvus]|uniref:Uncharacterized protein n=1 Tax=Staurois parvus TaxID=386267 RepID=A0ABN9G4U0_9NEOB|nr:unnamed protein product [Staurois parvus]